MLPSSRTKKNKNLLGGIFMGRKSKIAGEKKIEIVEKYLSGKLSLAQAARETGVIEESVRKWIMKYESGGPSALITISRNKHYSKEIKLAAVLAYFDGEGSQYEICKKFKISSTSQLQNWIKKYNTHEEFKSSSGGSRMSKARQTTFEERLEIVNHCLDNGKNYGASALKYQVSYQQVRNWVLKYEEMGIAGLEDRRGKRKGTLPSRTPEEELRDRIAQLERKNKQLEMENDALKKVRELAMKDRSR